MKMRQMSFLNPEKSHTWTVSDVNAYLRDVLESDYNLQDLWVQGEVSNLSRPRSGHVYFTLKDSQASLRCVMWKNIAARLETQIKEGDAIEAHGNISVYERSGQYQLYVDFLRPKGAGELYREFLRLKENLEREGLFAPEHKQEIPPWPKRVGIVTSATGAALQDMLNTLQRRYPLVDVFLAPSAVQGNQAPGQIVAGLRKLDQDMNVDIILLGRGGGSIEDLWAFNDERVARAVYDCQTPIISGVGHETDFTITDFVADLRAPTPTAAAELAVPDQVELRALVNTLDGRLKRVQQGWFSEQRWKLVEIESRLKRVSPFTMIQHGRQRVDELENRLGRAGDFSLQKTRAKVDTLVGRLKALNPDAILERGYTILTQEDGSLVRRIGQVDVGDHLNARVLDGSFDVIVEE